MTLYKWAFLGLSALLFQGTFIAPEWCVFGVFSFLVPIFYCASIGSLTFKDGLWWGTVFWGFHCFPIAVLLYEYAQGDLRLLLYLVLVLYCAAHTAVWFLLITLFKRIDLFSACIVPTLLYFLFVDHYMLWLMGCAQGWGLSFPLIPLTSHVSWLWALPIVGAPLLLLLLIVGAWALASFLVCKNFWYIMLTMAAWLPFFLGCGERNCFEEKPEQLEAIGYCCPPAVTICHPLDRAQEIVQSILSLRERMPQVTVIIMPESSFCFDLNEHPEIFGMLTQNALRGHCSLIMGSYRKDVDGSYNCLYNISNGLIINLYDKSFLAPFVEQISFPWTHCSIVENLFLQGKKGILTKKTQLSNFKIFHNFELVPQICSDLFIGQCAEARSLAPQVPFLVVVNDSWFSQKFMRQLLLLFAQFKAIEWQRDILYCGYFDGWWLNKKGLKWSLMA